MIPVFVTDEGDRYVARTVINGMLCTSERETAVEASEALRAWIDEHLETLVALGTRHRLGQIAQAC